MRVMRQLFASYLALLCSDLTAYAYGQPRIPGERWETLFFLPVEEDAAVASQLT